MIRTRAVIQQSIIPNVPLAPVPTPSFTTSVEAIKWMHNELHNKDEHCIDNGRFSFINDEIGMQGYEDAREQGCCGFYDREVLVAGRKATVGCNYGH